jgi:hypothetical protein
MLLHREAWADCDRRLNIEIAAHDLLSGLVQTVGTAAPKCGEDGAVVVGSAKLRSDPEQRRERRSPKESRPMVVNLILKTRKALRVRAGLAFQHNRSADWEDESRPDEQDAVLPERNLAIVSADKFRPLRGRRISPFACSTFA